MDTVFTPSPSPPHQTALNNVRRPQRKSTLTQQQKNQKRQRATQDQLVTLELEFNKNPTPVAAVRERIAQEINMTERSVQIWFQNRRAKIKTLAKKSLETGEECDAIPESMRQYLALQAMESGKGLFMGDRSRLSAYGNGNIFQDSQPQGKIVIHHFNCRSLGIGSWRRVGQNAMDLIVFYSPEKACLTYYINNDSAGYKIEYPFAYVEDIHLESHEVPSTNPNVQNQGQLVITLTHPPNFFMDSSGSGGFYQCGDFTEDQQASQVLTHYLGGHPKILAGQLAKLEVLDAFVNRHTPQDQQQQVTCNFTMFEPSASSISAPVSPHIVRPASSNDITSWQQQEIAPAHHFHQKHRRTRSRSMPIAMDFSQMQGSVIPSFAFESHHGDPNDQIFANASHPLISPSLQNALRIDTSPGFLEYRPSSTVYPISATTTASPSDYASPNLLGSSVHQDEYDTPYTLPYLSPMDEPTQLIGQSMSPISIAGANDQLIADDSPDLSHRDASADLFPDSSPYIHGTCLPDNLVDMYAKHQSSLATLTMHHDSPNLDDTESMQQMLQQYSMAHHSLSPNQACV